MKHLIGSALVAAAVLAVAFASPFSSPARASAQAPFVSPDAVATPIPGVPVTIVGPGLYRLASDLTGAPNTDGIVVAANHVTIDLGGFTLTGADGTGTGIRLAPDFSHLTVANGRLTNWNDGVSIHSRGNVRDVVAVSNANHGFKLTRSVAERCDAERNGSRGFELLESVARGCTARGNGATEFYAFTSTLEDCIAAESGDSTAIVLAEQSVGRNCRATGPSSSGAYVVAGSSAIGCVADGYERGFELIDESFAQDCKARDNSEYGYFASGSRLERCAAIGESATGIRLVRSAAAKDCTVSDTSRVGIDVRAGGVADGCLVVRGLGATARGDAVRVADAGVVHNCRIDQPVANGILVTGKQATITGNRVREAGGAGIVAGEHGLVAGNQVGDCAGAAIATEGDGNRFERNTVRTSAFGFRILGKDNLLFFNDNADNAVEYVVQPGNTRGPWITDQDYIQSTNPYCNFDLTF